MSIVNNEHNTFKHGKSKQFMYKFVDIETPYMGATEEEVVRNVRYARACIRDSLLRDEVPFASHLFFTQSGILDDNVPREREQGILAGKTIIERLQADTIVYTDLGISEGMKLGMEMARKSGREIKFRKLGENWEEEFSRHEINHSHVRVWLPLNIRQT